MEMGLPIIRSIIIIPPIPTAPLISSTDVATFPRVEDTEPPNIGIKLPSINFAPRIAKLSALAEIKVCELTDTVSTAIINDKSKV